MSFLPGGNALQHAIDTVIRVIPNPGVEPQYMTHYVRKNRVGPTVKSFHDRLEVVNNHAFVICVPGTKGWSTLDASWSASVAPGQFVRRRFQGLGKLPHGMCVAAIPAHQIGNDVPMFAVIWFR